MSATNHSDPSHPSIPTAQSIPAAHSDRLALGVERCLQIHGAMVRARALEEGLIRLNKSGHSYFWIGGPGEEAFNVCLGLQVKRGRGPQFDYLHLHYRSSAVLMAMGMRPVDAIRQAAMRTTDPFSQGRNFLAHYSIPEWNVVPVTSVVENQFAIAPGTALVQRRSGGDGITIVSGGEAGTAQGDFASCMIWSTRPDNQLPVLMITTNNHWGISTAAGTQHGERFVTDRGKAFGIRGEVVDGNDPVASWHAIARAMRHCRGRRHPYMLQANVSRLYGHSSASGAVRNRDEPDCLELFERRLLAARAVTETDIDQLHRQAATEIEQAIDQALSEPRPSPTQLYEHVFAPSSVDAMFPEGCQGLPH